MKHRNEDKDDGDEKTKFTVKFNNDTQLWQIYEWYAITAHNADMIS